VNGEQTALRPSANAVTVSVPAVLVDRETAAAALGMSLAHFERHVQPRLGLVYSGRLRLVPVRELERWASENAVRAGIRSGTASR
jgi:hypothetical protein